MSNLQRVNIEKLKVLLQSPKKIILIPHSRPDPDALGSVLALKYIFRDHSSVKVIAPTSYPSFLNWMPGQNEVIIHNKQSHQTCMEYIKNADLIFCVDFSNLSRLENLQKAIKQELGKNKIVLIDHHENAQDFADFVYWDPKAAASAELVYYFVHDIGLERNINTTFYELIYAGIMVDTGCFKFASTTSQVHQIASEVIKKNTNTNRIHRNIYDSFSLNRIQMLGYLLYEKLVYLKKYRTVYFTLSDQDKVKFSSQIGDTEGFVNYGLSVQGVILSAILIERGNHIKFSFRSVDDFYIADFAKLHFNGGGHKNASAGKLDMPLDKAVDYFKEKLATFYNEYFGI